MMPLYGYMDSTYPHQNEYRKPFPAYIPINPSKPPMVYEPWPCISSYGFPNPMPYHSCSNMPGFQPFRSPCPQPIPSPMHYYGGCNVPYYTDPNHVYNMPPPPPPHYTVEMPRYEFDKNVPRNQNFHCCECPNHHHRGEGGVKIQEQEMGDGEKKGNGSLVPIRVKGIPNSPVVWIPEEYLKEQGRRFGADERNHEPEMWNGDKIKYLTNGGDDKRGWDREDDEQKKDHPFPLVWNWRPSDDGKREECEKKEKKSVDGVRDLNSDDQMRQFPFPIIWMHPQDKKKDGVVDKGANDVNASLEVAESLPYVLKFVPMNHLGENNSLEGSKVKEENASGKDCAEAKAHKDISVKQNAPRKEEENKSEENEMVNKTSKTSGTDEKRQTTTLSGKSSNKLPPVCLRVDPLPKKKNGNGSSRSPSPPRSKGHSQPNSNGSTGALKESSQVESVVNNKEMEPKKRKTKEILVKERSGDVPTVTVTVLKNQGTEEMAEEKKDVDIEAKKSSEGPKVSVDLSPNTDVGFSEKPCIEKAGKDDRDSQPSVEMTEKARDLSKSDNGKRLEKKILSDAEAALQIQSVFRGYEVRRSQPLKKLKQIAEVRKDVVDVRNRILALESSSDFQKDNKQKLVLGETIMRLLLKLDTIQGLHPSLRDIRKSLAKELVTLQERLDSLVFESDKAKSEEKVGVEAKSSECKQESREETEGQQNSNSVAEYVQDQLLSEKDSVPSFEGEKDLIPSSDNAALSLPSEGDVLRDKVGSDLKLGELNSKTVVEQKNEVRDVCVTDMAEDRVDKVPKGEEARNEDANISEILSESLGAADVTATLDDENVVTRDDINQVASEVTSSVTEEMMATELETPKLADLPKVAIDEDGHPDKESVTDEIKKPNEAFEEKVVSEVKEETKAEDTTTDEIEKPDEAFKEKAVAEVKEEAKAEDTTPDEIKPNEVLEEKAVSEVKEEAKAEDATPDDIEKPNEASIEKAVSEVKVETNAGFEQQNEGSFPSETEETQQLRISHKDEASHHMSQENKIVEKSQEITNDHNSNGSEAANVVSGMEETTPMQATEQEEKSVNVPQIKSEMSNDESETENKSETRLIDESEKLREMISKLLEAGQQQLNAISSLNGRVEELEKKLSKSKKKIRTKCTKRTNVNGVNKHTTVGLSM